MTILACSTAKIPFCGIPRITRIPVDSGRNTWGTVKNLSIGMSPVWSGGVCSRFALLVQAGYPSCVENVEIPLGCMKSGSCDLGVFPLQTSNVPKPLPTFLLPNDQAAYDDLITFGSTPTGDRVAADSKNTDTYTRVEWLFLVQVLDYC